MSNFDENFVIDLTDSFVVIDHYVVSNDVVIELDDSPVQHNKAKKSKIQRKINKTRERPSFNFGDCPICWEELGKNPLASTKCGHVFCMKCLEQSLHQAKRCPSCRCTLKGASAYHPLYLEPQSLDS